MEDVHCQSWTAGSFKNVDLQAALFAQLLCVFCSVQLECYWSDLCYFSRKEAWNCFFFGHSAESTNQPKQLVSSPVLLLSASDQNAYHLTTCWYWDTCLAKGQGSRRLSKSNHSSGGSTYSWTADGCCQAAKGADLFGLNRWHPATVTTGTFDGNQKSGVQKPTSWGRER